MLKTIPVTPDYARAGAAAPEKPAELKLMLLPPVPDGRGPRPLLIVVPGGGYRYTSPREAEPVALRFLSAGFHAAVLRYSCAPSVWPAAALELAWCVREARRNAAGWGVDPERVYVIGFSAGGHLAASVSPLWREPPLTLPGEEISCRPDAQLLCYPVITLGEKTHAGSRDSLTGGNEALWEPLSLEKRVTPDTPATFLWHTAADASVPVENSLLYASTLRKAGVPFELHVYERGGHGLATADGETCRGPEQILPEVQGWIGLAVAFLKRR